jgi:hypothetical protein
MEEGAVHLVVDREQREKEIERKGPRTKDHI